MKLRNLQKIFQSHPQRLCVLQASSNLFPTGWTSKYLDQRSVTYVTVKIHRMDGRDEEMHKDSEILATIKSAYTEILIH